MEERSFGARLLRGAPRQWWSSATLTRSIIKTVVFVVPAVALFFSPDLSADLKGYTSLRWFAVALFVVYALILFFLSANDLWTKEREKSEKLASGNLALRTRLKKLRAEQDDVQQALRLIDQTYVEHDGRRVTMTEYLGNFAPVFGTGVVVDGEGLARYYGATFEVEFDVLRAHADIHLGRLASIGVLKQQDRTYAGSNHRYTAYDFTELGNRVVRRLLDERGQVSMTVVAKRAQTADASTV